MDSLVLRFSKDERSPFENLSAGQNPKPNQEKP